MQNGTRRSSRGRVLPPDGGGRSAGERGPDGVVHVLRRDLGCPQGRKRTVMPAGVVRRDGLGPCVWAPMTTIAPAGCTRRWAQRVQVDPWCPDIDASPIGVADERRRVGADPKPGNAIVGWSRSTSGACGPASRSGTCGAGATRWLHATSLSSFLPCLRRGSDPCSLSIAARKSFCWAVAWLR